MFLWSMVEHKSSLEKVKWMAGVGGWDSVGHLTWNRDEQEERTWPRGQKHTVDTGGHLGSFIYSNKYYLRVYVKIYICLYDTICM